MHEQPIRNMKGLENLNLSSALAALFYGDILGNTQAI